jgi:hypothetical protein
VLGGRGAVAAAPPPETGDTGGTGSCALVAHAEARDVNGPCTACQTPVIDLAIVVDNPCEATLPLDFYGCLAYYWDLTNLTTGYSGAEILDCYYDYHVDIDPGGIYEETTNLGPLDPGSYQLVVTTSAFGDVTTTFEAY